MSIPCTWWISCVLVADTLSFTEFVEAAERREMSIVNCSCEGIALWHVELQNEWGHVWRAGWAVGVMRDLQQMSSNVEFNSHICILCSHHLTQSRPQRKQLWVADGSPEHIFSMTPMRPHTWVVQGIRVYLSASFFFKTGNLELCSASDLSKSEV